MTAPWREVRSVQARQEGKCHRKAGLAPPMTAWLAPPFAEDPR